MTDRDRGGQTRGERARAVQRLQEAVARQRSLGDAHETAKDSSEKLTANAALQVADDEVSARERWLKSVDDHEY